MQYNKVTLVVAALAAGCLAAPQQGTQGLAGPRGHMMYHLSCDDPSEGAGTTTADHAKLEALAEKLDPNQRYCVDADGSTSASGGKNWSLVGGACGEDNSAIWLQSYVKGSWCLEGDVIANAAEAIILGCESTGDHKLYGSVRIDGPDNKQWVEVGKSKACDPS